MHDATTFRLLMVTPRFLPLTGGVENHVLEVARRLAKDMSVTVLTTDTTGELPDTEAVDGVAIRRVRAWPRERDYYVAPALYAHIARGRWDIVHVQSYHTAVAPLAMSAAAHAGIPYVLTFHGGGHSSALRSAVRGPQRALLRPLLMRAQRLVAVADFEASSFSRELHIPRARFSVIPNGSDLPLDAVPEVERRPHRIVSVGRLERYKGHHRVVEAMPYVLEHVRDAELHIIGTGPYAEEIHHSAERLGVSRRVRVYAIPPADRAAMASAMAEAGLLVSLSEFETHPLSIVEAVAVGTPALVADGSGLGELASRGLATPVAPDSPPASVAEAIVRSLREPQPVPVVRLPTWDDCASRLAALYAEVLTAHDRLAAFRPREA